MGTDHGGAAPIVDQLDEVLAAAGVPRHIPGLPGGGGYHLLPCPTTDPSGVVVSWAFGPQLAEAIGAQGAQRTADAFNDSLAELLDLFGFPVVRTAEDRALVVGLQRRGSPTVSALWDLRFQSEQLPPAAPPQDSDGSDTT